MNQYITKSYNKQIKLTDKQCNLLLSELNLPDEIRYKIVELLKYKGQIIVDRTSKDKASFYTELGVLDYFKHYDQTGRKIVMAAITANNYRHFVRSVCKKAKKVPLLKK